MRHIFETKSGQQVDGVITVDVVALERIIGVVGPVPLDDIGETLTGDTTARILLKDVYQRFPEAKDNDARRAVLGNAAKAVAARLSAGGYPTAKLGALLTDMVRQRHIMAWSSRPDEQAQVARAGLGGGLPDDRLPIMAAVENVTANKLDFYLGVSGHLDLRFEGATVTGALSVTLTNTVPDGLAPYVVGPNEGLDLAPGTYRAVVAVWLPRGTVIDGVGGDAAELHRGDDGGYSLSTSFVEMAPGATKTATLRFTARLAPGVRAFPLTFVPQGRLRTVPVSISATLGNQWAGPTSLDLAVNSPAEGNWLWRGEDS